MPCRKIVTAKHMQVARLLIDGESGYRALRQAGYSHWSSRNLGLVLRHSWGLREAVRRAEERSGQYLIPRPVHRRRDKYARRGVANAVRQYVTADIQGATTNTLLHKLHASAKHAEAIAEGKYVHAIRCSLCRGLTEGQDHWCPCCQRIQVV